MRIIICDFVVRDHLTLIAKSKQYHTGILKGLKGTRPASTIHVMVLATGPGLYKQTYIGLCWPLDL